MLIPCRLPTRLGVRKTFLRGVDEVQPQNLTEDQSQEYEMVFLRQLSLYEVGHELICEENTEFFGFLLFLNVSLHIS